ncbi:MAG TPA: hypothetical protein VKA63_06330, partial [Candidatus Krumholzibacteria bacterium]|nr:hypothetical protein [Candidatus Krumholzibacteria bacterium]
MDQAAYSNAVFYITGLDKRYKINKRVGWLYAAYNPIIGGSVLKIGMSSRPPPQRGRELAQSTGYEDRIATGGITCTPGSIDPNDCTFNSGYTVADSALYTYDKVGSRTDHSAVIGTGDRPSSFDGYSLT